MFRRVEALVMMVVRMAAKTAMPTARRRPKPKVKAPATVKKARPIPCRTSCEVTRLRENARLMTGEDGEYTVELRRVLRALQRKVGGKDRGEVEDLFQLAVMSAGAKFDVARAGGQDGRVAFARFVFFGLLQRVRDCFRRKREVASLQGMGVDALVRSRETGVVEQVARRLDGPTREDEVRGMLVERRGQLTRGGRRPTAFEVVRSLAEELGVKTKGGTLAVAERVGLALEGTT